MSPAPMSPLYRKIAWRLVPFLMLLYMVAFLDRVNISFAALTMNRDLGISESVYGFAAGVFFLSYCLFEVPANLVLARLGARRWLAILMVVWGFVSMGTAFVHTEAAYIAVRFLLGIAESGFYPGVIYYFTFWLPRTMRTRILALFLLAVPLCNSIGSPISAHILLLNNVAGMRGWQWLFLLEGVPAVILGIAAWFLLADGPWSAGWISSAEREQIIGDLHQDEIQQPDSGKQSLHVARDCIIYFLWSSGNYGLTFWLPRILTAVGASNLATGWWATVTFGFGALAMLWASRRRGFRALAVSVSRVVRRIHRRRSGALYGHCRRRIQSCCHGNSGVAAHVLEPRRQSPFRQSCRSRDRPCQLRRRRWSLCRTLRYGLAPRPHAPLLRRPLGYCRRHGDWRIACLWRIRQTCNHRGANRRLGQYILM